jgi:hypothetical protein
LIQSVSLIANNIIQSHHHNTFPSFNLSVNQIFSTTLLNLNRYLEKTTNQPSNPPPTQITISPIIQLNNQNTSPTFNSYIASINFPSTSITNPSNIPTVVLPANLATYVVWNTQVNP